MNFKDLKINEKIMNALEEMGYEKPTPIQEQAIPHILDGKDLLGCAQTGTGKTAAFAIPLIEKLLNDNNEEPKQIKVLILTPTRELAIQIRDNFRSYGKYANIKCSVIFGGVNQNSQIEVLKKGVDVLVATPGRLLDLINQRYAKLNNVSSLVLDEADTMLDMGFIHDVKKIIAHIPTNRQTLMFSATMPKEINTLAETFLKDYVTVKVNPVSSTVEIIDQKIYFVDRQNKVNLLIDIMKKEDIKSVLIFTRTKHGANKLSTGLTNANITNGVIHGNKSQNARVSALNNFKSGITRVLIATDIAARGIDISGLSHVINFDMPEQAETYVHRIGRTGRAGLDGIAISLCDVNEKSNLRDIENLIKQNITEVIDHNYPMMILQPTPKTQKNNPQFKSRGSNKGKSSNIEKKPSINNNNTSEKRNYSSKNNTSKSQRNGFNNSKSSNSEIDKPFKRKTDDFKPKSGSENKDFRKKSDSFKPKSSFENKDFRKKSDGFKPKSSSEGKSFGSRKGYSGGFKKKNNSFGKPKRSNSFKRTSYK